MEPEGSLPRLQVQPPLLNLSQLDLVHAAHPNFEDPS